MNQKEWVSLRARHGYRNIYDAGRQKELNADELATCTEEARKSLTRRPLEDDDRSSLKKLAWDFDARAHNTQQEVRAQQHEQREQARETRAQQRERWWWLQYALMFLSAILGFLGAAVGAYFKARGS